jgi:hypothetical protein
MPRKNGPKAFLAPSDYPKPMQQVSPPRLDLKDDATHPEI